MALPQGKGFSTEDRNAVPLEKSKLYMVSGKMNTEITVRPDVTPANYIDVDFWFFLHHFSLR